LRPASTVPGWLGVVVAEASVELATRVEGRVESVRVRVGDPVKQGDVVATLEARSAQQELAVAEAELLSKRAELRVVALSLEEARERLKRRSAPGPLTTGAISEEELSTARYEERMAVAKLEIARTQVLQHEARVAQFRQRVTEASIRAPFEGVVASRYVHPGALLQVGQPVVHLLRKGALQVRFAIPSSQVRQVEVGQGLVLEVMEQDRQLKGHVTQLAPEVDVAARMVFAMAEVDGADATHVPAGTVVRVRVDSSQLHVDVAPGARNDSNNH
jgi:RND family efflux transporter MFP subunit